MSEFVLKDLVSESTSKPAEAATPPIPNEHLNAVAKILTQHGMTWVVQGTESLLLVAGITVQVISKKAKFRGLRVAAPAHYGLRVTPFKPGRKGGTVNYEGVVNKVKDVLSTIETRDAKKAAQADSKRIVGPKDAGGVPSLPPPGVVIEHLPSGKFSIVYGASEVSAKQATRILAVLAQI